MKTLSPIQQRAVDSQASRILCIAGAGSGKTHTASQRVKALIARGVEPNKIVVLTFTNAAAHEFKKRITKSPCCERDHDGDGNCDRHPKGIKLGFVGTLHAFIVRMLREHGSAVGVFDGFTVIDEEQRDELLQRVAVEQKCRESFIGLERRLAAYFKQKAIGRFNGDKVCQAYELALGDANALDFDLLLVRGVQLFSGCNLTFRFSHLFVDEFQDSGDLDAMLYESMPFSQRFFVGDPDQAIYSFRGGNVDHILAACSRAADASFSAEPVADAVPDVFVLEENYRCARAICDSAQRLVEYNANRYPKKTTSANDDDGEIRLWAHAEPDSELRAIAREIKDTNCQDDCAVLFATNDLCRRAIEVFSQDFGIAIKAKGLGDTPPDFNKARSLMSFAVNPGSDLLARRVLESRVGKDEASRIALKAAQDMQTINEAFFKLKPCKTPFELFSFLREQISVESHQKLTDILTKLEADATAVDLIVAATKDMYHRDEIGNGTVVTTFHSAKGREFGTVFLGACEQAVIPSARVSVNIEEQRRLFYVGMTRAKRRLFLSYSRQRAAFGQRRTSPTTPSRFIAEAGFHAGI